MPATGGSRGLWPAKNRRTECKGSEQKRRGTLGSIGGAPRVRSMIACTIVESTNYLAIMLLYECGRHGTVVRPRQVEWRSGSAGISQGMLKQHCTYTK